MTDAAKRRGERDWGRTALGLLALLLVAGGGYWAWTQWPVDPLQQARSAYREGRYRDALDLANTRLRQSPEDREALRLSARSSARLERDQAAANLFLRLGSKGAEAEDLTLLASSLERLGKPGDAEKLLRDAIRLEPNHPESLDRLARLLGESDQLAEAAELAERLERQAQHAPKGAARLGLIREKQGDPEGAAAAFQRVLVSKSGGMDPLDDLRIGALRRRLVRAFLSLGRPEEATAVLTSDPAARGRDDPEYHWLLSRAALQRGDREEALAAWRRAEAVTPSGEPAAHAQEEPAPFVGAERCAECHRDIHDDQQSSRHALTFHRAGTLGEKDLPATNLDDPGNPAVTLAVGPGNLSARAGDDVARAVVAYVMGSGRHARTPLGRDEDGRWRELRLTRYATIDGWDVTPGHPLRLSSSDPRDHLGEIQSHDSLRRCLGCHVTNPHAILSNQQGAPETRDRGIGCERCHGPGGNHVAAAALKFPDVALTRFRPGSAGVRAGVMKVCGDCHGTEGRRIPGADPAATVRFQGTTLTWSRCFTESRGRFDCLSCHDAHRGADEPLDSYDARCLACHDQAEPSHAEGVSPMARTSCPVNPRSNCVTCHMPKARSIVPHVMFTDHHIRINPAANDAVNAR